MASEDYVQSPEVWALRCLEIARQEINVKLGRGVSSHIDRSDLESAANGAIAELIGGDYALVRLRIRSRISDESKQECHESLDAPLPDGVQREITHGLPGHSYPETADKSQLNSQQRRIYDLLAQGRTQTEVATTLGVTQSAISQQVKAMRAALSRNTQWSDFSSNPRPDELYRQAAVLEEIGELRWSAYRDCSEE